ncbi:MAG: hypothetical protein K2W96_28480 [Gemmataceae bacterium]|nr:hypothetical protein [Gemmataceae bacterium]
MNLAVLGVALAQDWAFNVFSTPNLEGTFGADPDGWTVSYTTGSVPRKVRVTKNERFRLGARPSGRAPFPFPDPS